MKNEQTCRHCGESFEPRPGKPGYVDECPSCLFEKTALETLRQKTTREAFEEIDRLIEKARKVHNMTREEFVAGMRSHITKSTNS